MSNKALSEQNFDLYAEKAPEDLKSKRKYWYNISHRIPNDQPLNDTVRQALLDWDTSKKQIFDLNYEFTDIYKTADFNMLMDRNGLVCMEEFPNAKTRCLMMSSTLNRIKLDKATFSCENSRNDPKSWRLRLTLGSDPK